MFKMTATAGRNVSTVSSWKDEISRTAKSSGSPTSSSAGVPRFPAARARAPAAQSSASSKQTVVDFPFVPVTAMIGAEMDR